MGVTQDIDETYRCFINSIPGIGKKTMRRLFEEDKKGKEVYEMKEEKLKKYLNIRQLKSFLKCRKEVDAFEYEKKMHQAGISFYSENHEKYPKRLHNIPDAPFGIYVKGDLPPENVKSAAIIGARMCSQYGRSAAREFGIELASAGIPIISGLARGVDGISQKAALEAGGKSFGILGCGVDICYPNENRGLYDQIWKQGGLISEYPPTTVPAPGNFPPRNRIISGLSDVVLVIEAKEKSGTLITVDMALEQGKEVCALPGRVTDALSKGCNRLIKQGATIVTEPGDILEILSYVNINIQKSERDEIEKKEDCRKINLINLSLTEKAIYEILDYYPQSVDVILLQYQGLVKRQEETSNSEGESVLDFLPQLTVIELLNELMNLTLSGVATTSGGGYFGKI